MGLKGFILGALVGGRAIVASPQRPGFVPFPVQNVTKTEPTPTAGVECQNQCSVYYPQVSAISWIPASQITYTEKVTVATVSVIITTDPGSNRTYPTMTETVYNYVPPEYNLYSRGSDKQGTAVITVPVPQADGLTVWLDYTYPTPYLAYSTEYSWEGVLQTHDKELSPACATAGPELANVPLPMYPEYPQPKRLPPVDENDPFGNDYKPMWVPVEDQPDKQFFDQVFPSESAFTYCKSVPSKPTPTQFEAPKFVTVTTTVYLPPASRGIIIVQPTATGWEVTSTSQGRPNVTPDIPRILSTASGFEQGTGDLNVQTSAAVIHIESTASGFGSSRPRETEDPRIPEFLVTRLLGNIRPSSVLFQEPGRITPAPAVVPTPERPFAAPTPIFTYVTTVIDGQTSTIPAYILPGSSATATIGQTVTINGEATVLAPPPAIFTSISTTINGVPTIVPAYIINGTSTATLGQTVTIDGQPTVLAPPSVVVTWLPVTINGVPTSTAVYIISGSSTATVGQTVIINGTTTVLSNPTESNSGPEGPATTTTGDVLPTGLPRDGGAGAVKISISSFFVCIGAAVIVWL